MGDSEVEIRAEVWYSTFLSLLFILGGHQHRWVFESIGPFVHLYCFNCLIKCMSLKLDDAQKHEANCYKMKNVLDIFHAQKTLKNLPCQVSHGSQQSWEFIFRGLIFIFRGLIYRTTTRIMIILLDTALLKKLNSHLCDFLLQTIATTLKRDSKGLGFSIAGGRGSTPYKGNDEVGWWRVWRFSLYAHWWLSTKLW